MNELKFAVAVGTVDGICVYKSNRRRNRMLSVESPMEQAEDLPNASVRETLERLIGHKDYKLQLACAKGNNYLGIVWRIDVAGKQSLVLKLPPQNQVRRKQFFARPCFQRETLAYEQFLPLCRSFQADRKLPVEQRFRHFARYFAGRQDDPNECIVLEDLCRSGFQMHDRFVDLTVGHVSLVIVAYAKLHAISLAMKREKKEELQPFRELVDIFEQRRSDQGLAAYFEQLKQNALDALAPQTDGFYIDRLKNYFGRGSYFELLSSLLSGLNCEPFAVVCHGDSWNNNFLYRYQPDSTEPSEVCLIDWQLMRYASPVTDLAYFLFTCTTREFRQKHYEAMLQLYYEQLGRQLTRLGEEPEALFPYTAFQQQLHEKGAVGLLLAMMVLPIVTIRTEDAPDLQVISDMVEGGTATNLHKVGFLGDGNESLYKRRMRGVILDCVHYDYI